MYLLFCPIVIFLFGLIVGSFLNCVIYRLETGGSFLKGRSFCPHCKHKLALQDLIPVFSFLFLKGKCRYCGQKISPQYPIIEIATGLLFLPIFNFQFSVFNEFSISQFSSLLYYWTIASFLIIVFVYDLKHYIIPDKVIYPAIAIALIFNFQFLISKQFLIFNSQILSAFGAAAFFAAIVLVSRGKWMGIGDIKLAFLMGLILGWPNIFVALSLAFFIGAIMGIGLIIFGRKKMKSEIPLGPFLITGTFLIMFFGNKIMSWYLNLFLLK